MKIAGRSDRVIKPNATEEFEISLSSANRSGKFTRKIGVTTNDPNQPSDSLACVGNVLVPFKTVPRTVNFGQLKRSAEAQTKTVVLTRGDGGPLSPEVQPSRRPNVKTNLREIEQGDKYELDVTIEPPWPNTLRFRDLININTGVPEAPRGSVTVHAQIVPRLEAQPKQFSLPGAFPQGLQRTANLIWDDGNPGKIIDATVNDPELSVEVVEQGGRQRLVLSVPEGYQQKPGRRQVTVRTEDADAPTLQVPVSFTRSSAGRPAVNRAKMPRGRSPQGRPPPKRMGTTATEPPKEQPPEEGK
ncbi:MAG: hypothetical protein JSU68_13490 [Phycisphaerales bacterium]|nr:MAG: hypothetical protein JSU68_13490 [Phycisphaerales bacterium]